jgi:hypothetical protein
VSAQRSAAAPSPTSGQTRYWTSQQAGAAIAGVVAAAELAILQAMASLIAQVLAGTLLAALARRQLRVMVLAIVTRAEQQIRVLIAQTAAAARADVERVIAADLGPLARLLPLIPSASMPKLSASLRNALQAAANEAAAEFRAILADPQQAQQLLDELAATGLTGFTGRRRWNLSAYAQMAARTAAERLHLDLQLRALTDAGQDLVYVARDSSLPPCGKCAPWVRRVLSVNGRDLGMPGVAGTVAQARAAGLLHPSCRDSLTPWSGVMAPGGPQSPQWLAAQRQRYAREQEANARQNAWRQAQRQHAVALTPLARARARRLMRRLAP